MGIPRPKTGWRWLVAQTATFDLATAGFTAIVGLTSAINYAFAGRPVFAATISAATVCVLLLTIAKNTVALNQARQKDSVHELEGCLHTLHAILDPTAIDYPGRERLANHVPAAESLEQITEYIGDEQRGRIGRRFPANAGIIGKAYLEQDVFLGRRLNDDYDLYIEELVRDWNFTREHARRINPGVMEWMAVPIFDRDRNRVQAIVYADSNRRGFFTPEQQELILAAVNGIALFVGKRYS